MKTNRTYYLLFFAVFILLNSCKKDDDQPTGPGTATYSSEVATSWVGLMLKLTKETPGFSPPVVARVHGYAGLTLYESVRPGMPGYKSLEGQLTAFTAGTVPAAVANAEYHWGAVANASLSVLVKGCFKTTSPENLILINDLEAQFFNQFQTESSEDVIARSVAFGQAVGNAILAFAESDGQGECYKTNFPASYIVPVGDGLWEPTSPTNLIPLQPYWGNVRPFLVSNVADILPVPPPAYSTDPTSAFFKEAMEVYTTVNALTPDQLVIAEYWSDDPGKTATPPGHSCSIMKQILEDEQADLARAAEVYAKLGMAVHDAFVSCWYAKYQYNLVRPITFVHDHIDNTWTIPLATPPFPEYTSGHSVQSGASAKVLTDLYGSTYSFVDRTHADRSDIDGTPRAFPNFYAFAEEAAISRLYGGIHFRSAIDVGVAQGIKVGNNIGSLQFR